MDFSCYAVKIECRFGNGNSIFKWHKQQFLGLCLNATHLFEFNCASHKFA